MLLSRGDHLLTTAELARLLGVRPGTIRSWRSRRYTDSDGASRPYLAIQGLDERGRPLHTAAAGRAAERLVRERGIATTGIDPRQMRCRTAVLAAWPGWRPGRRTKSENRHGTNRPL